MLIKTDFLLPIIKNKKRQQILIKFGHIICNFSILAGKFQII